MTSTTVSDITQTAMFLSDAKYHLPVQPDNSAAFRNAVTNAVGGSPAGFSDTISISYRSRQAVGGGMAGELPPEVANKEKVKKEEANVRIKVQSSDNSPAKVEFVYNQRGELIVKYMDASDRLVYQIPSELVLFQKESASKLTSSVDANV
ncbi:MAG: hypothetical protein ACOYL3_11040 [Desulfuromonadaceae bacterium]